MKTNPTSAIASHVRLDLANATEQELKHLELQAEHWVKCRRSSATKRQTGAIVLGAIGLEREIREAQEANEPSCLHLYWGTEFSLSYA